MEQQSEDLRVRLEDQGSEMKTLKLLLEEDVYEERSSAWKGNHHFLGLRRKETHISK